MNALCSKCRGGKEILGKGLFYITCPECNGVGHVFEEKKEVKEDIKEDIVTKKDNDNTLQPQVLKKSTRGRKKKVDKLG